MCQNIYNFPGIFWKIRVEVQRLRCLAKLYLSSCLQIPFRSKRERSLNTVTYYMSNVFWPAWAIDLFAKKSGHQGARICGAVCPGMPYLPSNVKPTENGRKVSGHTPDYGNAINSLLKCETFANFKAAHTHTHWIHGVFLSCKQSRSWIRLKPSFRERKRKTIVTWILMPRKRSSTITQPCHLVTVLLASWQIYVTSILQET